MLAFVTSIRHPLNANSYPRVIELLDRTLTSVCRQTDGDYRVLVVCNEIPGIRERDRVRYVKVDFPPPTSLPSAQTGLEAVRVDKGCKYFAGLLAARELDPTHVMFFDADDYVSRSVAAHVNAHPDLNGWVIKRGFLYREGSYFVRELTDFHRWNGSCNIIRFDLLNVPASVEPDVPQDEVLSTVDPYFLRGILGAHPFTESYFDVIGKPLRPLPFPGAVYVIGTGENHSGLLAAGGRRKLDEALVEEFGMKVPDFTVRGYVSERFEAAVGSFLQKAGRRP